MIQKILAIGAGNMGSQVSFYHAMNGVDVVQYDISPASLEACKALHETYIDAYKAARPNTTDAEVQAGLARIQYSSDLTSAVEGVDLVIESAPEDPEIKAALYAQLNDYCDTDTIFCTNTSTLLPSQLAEASGRPEKFLAFHYAMGIWDAPIAEVMRHEGTDHNVFTQLVDFAERSQLVPIKLEKEQPGYIINSLLVPWLTAGWSLVANGIASHQDVDKTWMICSKMAVGPLGIADMLGFEVARNVNRLLVANNPDNPQFQKNLDFIENEMIAKGRLGANSGKGFYDYPNPEYMNPDFLK